MKTVLITGASTGIGRAAVMKFYEEGWNVIATMRSPEKETQLNKLNNILVLRLDVQKPDTIKKAVATGIEKFGKIDVVVNNAGAAILGVFEYATEDQVFNVFDINVFGPMRVLRTVLPYFRNQHSGTIINISSQGGRVTFPNCSVYHATKFCLEGFTESLSYEMLPFGIRTKIVEPGSTLTNFIDTAVFASGEIAPYNDFMEAGHKNWVKNDTLSSQPEEIAATIFKAATDENDQLRYKSGRDTEFYLEKMGQAEDQDYIEFMRQRFIPEYLNSTN